jgi:amino-acid N-acetyltransferase
VTEQPLRVHPVTDADLADAERLLSRVGLPTSDVPAAFDRAVVASRGGERVGVGALEVHGRAGLLRSVAVEPTARGTGVGTAVCDALAAAARDAGVERLYLLTTTASDFFRARGFVPCDRESVPAAVRATTQFAELCPDSAACLTRSLTDGAGGES